MELLELVKIVDTHQNQANVQQQIDTLRATNLRASDLYFSVAMALIILVVILFTVNLVYAWYETWQLDKRLKKLEAKSEQRPISDYPLRSSET